MKKILFMLVVLIFGSGIIVAGEVPEDIVFVGDSIMDSSKQYIAPNFKNPYFDTKISRQFSTLPGIVTKLVENGKLKTTLVVHLGTNGKFTDKDFDYVMKMANGKDVFFMNTAHKDPWEQEVNKKLKEKVAQYPNAYLIDWYSYAKGKNQYFYKDRTHPNDKGQRYYADFLTNEIKKHYLEENKEEENKDTKNNDSLKNNPSNPQNNDGNSEKIIDLRNLKKDTKEKIKEVVDKYNYTPNTFAKALKSTDSKIIGVIVPCLHSYVSSNTLKYIDENLKKNNYETLIMNANFDEEKQLEYIRKLARMNVDGIILLPTTMSKSYEDTIKSIDVPVVLLGQEGEYTYSVEYNDFNAARDLTNFVLASGHRKIAYMGVGEEDIAVGYYRKLGVMRTLENYNLDSKDVFITNFGLENSYRLINENIDRIRENTCLICATDNLAYGAIKALEEHGLSVGDNFSVAAFGDYASSSLLKSPLTTIKFDLKEAAKKTVEMLLKVIKEEETEMKILIGYDLKTRKSVVDLNNYNRK